MRFLRTEKYVRNVSFENVRKVAKKSQATTSYRQYAIPRSNALCLPRGNKATSLASSRKSSKMNCAHGGRVLEEKLIFRKLKKNIKAARKERQEAIGKDLNNKDDGINRRPSGKPKYQDHLMQHR